METACRYGSKPAAYTSPTAEDVSLEVLMDGEGPKMGKDAELTIKLRNNSSEKRSIILHSQVAVMYYTGVLKATVKKDRTDVDMLPNEGEWLYSAASLALSKRNKLESLKLTDTYSCAYLCFFSHIHREYTGVGPGVQNLQGPPGRSGCTDADTVRQGQRNTAGPGHSVQLPTQDPRPHHKGKPHSW